jgi:hypothetical protein
MRRRGRTAFEPHSPLGLPAALLFIFGILPSRGFADASKQR